MTESPKYSIIKKQKEIEMKIMNKIKKQFMGFLLISGTGWLMDVGVYSIFTMLLGINIFFSNTISSILAITFVFCI